MNVHLVALDYFVAGQCGVCGETGRHNHFDTHMGELIGVCCWSEALDAELQARAWTHRAGAPLSAEELERRVFDFEHSRARSRPRIRR